MSTKCKASSDAGPQPAKQQEVSLPSLMGLPVSDDKELQYALKLFLKEFTSSSMLTS